MLDLLYMEILAFLLIAFVIFIVYTVKRKKYEKTEYFAQTHHVYISQAFKRPQALPL